MRQRKSTDFVLMNNADATDAWCQLLQRCHRCHLSTINNIDDVLNNSDAWASIPGEVGDRSPKFGVEGALISKHAPQVSACCAYMML